MEGLRIVYKETPVEWKAVKVIEDHGYCHDGAGFPITIYRRDGRPWWRRLLLSCPPIGRVEYDKYNGQSLRFYCQPPLLSELKAMFQAIVEAVGEDVVGTVVHPALDPRVARTVDKKWD